MVLACMVALTDFTEANGATRLVPNSHKLPYPKPTKEEHERWLPESVPAVMPRGSVVFWEGQVYHGGGENRTAERRYGVLVNYCLGYLRTQENFMLSCGEEKDATFSEDLQRLIGYRIGPSGLGQVFAHNPRPMVAKVVPETDDAIHKRMRGQKPSIQENPLSSSGGSQVGRARL